MRRSAMAMACRQRARVNAWRAALVSLIKAWLDKGIRRIVIVNVGTF